MNQPIVSALDILVFLTLRDISQGLVTAPRSHAVIIMDLRRIRNILLFTYLFHVVFMKLKTLHKKTKMFLCFRHYLHMSL